MYKLNTILYFVLKLPVNSKVEDGITKTNCTRNSTGDGVSQFSSRSSPVPTTPTHPSSVSVSMPPLFPRPTLSTSFSKHDILTSSPTSDSLLLPSSLPHALYSNSFPLFGHRYLTNALTHAAAAASLLPHQSNTNPFLRLGGGSLNQPTLSNHSSSSQSIPSSALTKAIHQTREDCSPSTNSIEDLQPQSLVQVPQLINTRFRTLYVYYIYIYIYIYIYNQL